MPSGTFCPHERGKARVGQGRQQSKKTKKFLKKILDNFGEVVIIRQV
jgi:hypothetical protein